MLRFAAAREPGAARRREVLEDGHLLPHGRERTRVDLDDLDGSGALKFAGAVGVEKPASRLSHAHLVPRSRRIPFLVSEKLQHGGDYETLTLIAVANALGASTTISQSRNAASRVVPWAALLRGSVTISTPPKIATVTREKSP